MEKEEKRQPFNLSKKMSKKKEPKEGPKNNPWAICNKSVGQDDKEKFERCVLKVKEKHGTP
jgi:hypothetical protein